VVFLKLTRVSFPREVAVINKRNGLVCQLSGHVLVVSVKPLR